MTSDARRVQNLDCTVLNGTVLYGKDWAENAINYGRARPFMLSIHREIFSIYEWKRFEN